MAAIHSRRYRERRTPEQREEALLDMRRRAKLRLYGVTPEQYDAMLAEQRGVCAICKQPETSEYRGRVKDLAVDHCHKSGRVRGLLCCNCNRGIGNLGDNAGRARAAADYLEAHDRHEKG